MARDEEPAFKGLTKNPLGPCGEAVAANVEHLRTSQNLTFAALSDQLEMFGRSIPPLGLRKIVARTRRVDADDLAALAIVLGVSPATLLMPNVATVAKDDLVEVTGWPHKPVTASVIWDWLTARRPLIRGTDFGFIERALPTWVQELALADIDRWRVERHRQGVDELGGGGRWKAQDGDD